jgi:hypothetical protein
MEWEAPPSVPRYRPMQFHAVQCSSMFSPRRCMQFDEISPALCHPHAVSGNSMRSHAVLRRRMLSHAVPCRPMPWRAVSCSAMPHGLFIPAPSCTQCSVLLSGAPCRPPFPSLAGFGGSGEDRRREYRSPPEARGLFEFGRGRGWAGACMEWDALRLAIGGLFVHPRFPVIFSHPGTRPRGGWQEMIGRGWGSGIVGRGVIDPGPE